MTHDFLVPVSASRFQVQIFAFGSAKIISFDNLDVTYSDNIVILKNFLGFERILLKNGIFLHRKMNISARFYVISGVKV